MHLHIRQRLQFRERRKLLKNTERFTLHQLMTALKRSLVAFLHHGTVLILLTHLKIFVSHVSFEWTPAHRVV